MESIMRTISPSITLLLTLAVIYFLGWSLQTQILLNWDVSWLMHASAKLLAGGTYAKDFFELNPPLILYLYLPAIFITKVFGVTIIIALRAYFFLLGTLSLYLCHRLSLKFFCDDNKTAAFFLGTIATAFFILPLEQFGQREHFLIILTLPYLLSVSCQLDEPRCKQDFAIMIGLLAGLGFAIKPYFLITFLAVECYYMVRTRSFYAWFRTEVLTIMMVIVFYLSIVCWLHQDYLFTVVPLNTRIYYAGVSQAWWDLANYSGAITCYFAGLFYCLQYHKKQYHTLRTVFFIATTGFLTVYFIQHTLWYSHILPAFTCGILLLVLEFDLFVSQAKIGHTSLLTTSCLTGVACAVLIYNQIPLQLLLVFHPFSFFMYFTLLFAFLLYSAQVNKNLLTIAMILFVIMSLGYSITQLILQTDFYPYRFQVTVCVLIMLFYLLIPKSKISKYHLTTAAMVGAVLFSYAFYFMNSLYNSSLIKIIKMQPIIAFLRDFAAEKPVAFFSSQSFYAYPNIDYAHATPSLRFQFLGWVPSLLKQKNQLNPVQYAQSQSDKDFLIGMLAEDLNSNKPVYILVDANNNKENITAKNFDYVSYLSENSKFRQAWQSYRYFTTLVDPSMYKLIVYKRS
jgi:hypothetical protein